MFYPSPAKISNLLLRVFVVTYLTNLACVVLGFTPPLLASETKREHQGFIAQASLNEYYFRIFNQFVSNPAAFNDKYSNSRFDLDLTFISLTGPQEGYYTMSFSDLNGVCAFKAKEKQSIINLRYMDKVSISGYPYMPAPGLVLIYDCKIRK